MFRKIGLIALLVFSGQVLAGNFFIGASGGGNVTRSTPVGDLPMAREEFGINDQRSEDYQIFFDLINVDGLTSAEALEARKDLNFLKLHYSKGWDVALHGGYQCGNVVAELIWRYIDAKYRSLTLEGMNNGAAYFLGNLSGKATFNSFLAFGEYNGFSLKIYNFTPTVGIGAGVAIATDELTVNSVTTKRSQTVLAYQGKLGLKYEFNKNLEGVVEGVFFGTGKIKATNNYLKQGQINLGVRWSFN